MAPLWIKIVEGLSEHSTRSVGDNVGNREFGSADFSGYLPCKLYSVGFDQFAVSQTHSDRTTHQHDLIKIVMGQSPSFFVYGS